MNHVLFACVHNAGRSQMAEAFFNRMANPCLAHAISAGTEPADRVHPEVVAAMGEVGIDLSSSKPRHLTSELASQASVLVTMGCRESCPVAARVKREDWELPDPAGQTPERIRQIRDEILELVRRMIAANKWGS